MHRFAALLLPLFVVLACGADRPKRRPSPQQTLETLKRAMARRDHAAEWATLSPGFKRRMSRKAGRNVDVGDYISVRRTHAKNKRIRELEGAIPNTRMLATKYDNKGHATCTIKFSLNTFLGQSVKIEMINHALWQLRVKGEAQPYWGFVGHKSPKIFRGKDGSYTVRTQNRAGKVTWQKRFTAAQVVSYRTTNRWYFHNFGKLEEEFFDLK